MLILIHLKLNNIKKSIFHGCLHILQVYMFKLTQHVRRRPISYPLKACRFHGLFGLYAGQPLTLSRRLKINLSVTSLLWHERKCYNFDKTSFVDIIRIFLYFFILCRFSYYRRFELNFLIVFRTISAIR